MTVKGLDVSSWQGKHYPLNGADFVFVKATEGTSYVNPEQMEQASWARTSGAVVGWYHYLKPGDMKAQAAYFVEKCGSVHGDPLWADWEDAGVSCEDKDTFLREVLRLRGKTHRVGLYCNRNYWLNHDTTSYAADALWIADYNGRPGRPSIQAHWLFHQYTSDPIDTSVGRFADRGALRAWAEKKDQAPPEKKETNNMPSAEDIASAVWNWDGVDPVHPTKDNPKWQAENVLTEVLVRLDRTEQAVQGLAAKAGAKDGTLQVLLGLVQDLGADGGLTAEQIETAAKAGAHAALAELGEQLVQDEPKANA